LISSFDEVIIVPTASDAPLSQRRELPDSVEVIKPGGERASKSALRFLIRYPLRFAKQVSSAVLEHGLSRDALEEIRFRVRAEARTRELLERFGRQDLSRTVFYAYWLHLPAAVAVRLREMLTLAVPIVSRAHRFDIYGRGAHGFLPQREHIISQVDSVFAVSEAGAQHLRQTSPAFAHRVSVSRLGTPPAVARTHATQELRLVRSCSRVVPFKRLPLLIEGIAEAQRRGLEVHWEHIGRIDGEYAESVERFATSALKPSSFTFVGQLSNEEVREWHAGHPASVFVNVSESEGVPVSILEALAVGLPVIATDVGGSAETIDVTSGMFDGLLSADCSPQEIATRLEALFALSGPSYSAHSDASLRHWARRWSSDTNFSEFATILLKKAREVELLANAAEANDNGEA
jgi:glycosyltransferase involved in cell wall biosynthesis